MTELNTPASAAPGQQLTVPVTVKNQGTASARNFNVTLYFSTDSTITTSDRWLNAAYVGSIAAGAQQTFNLVVTVPAAVNGTYYLGVIADPGNGVIESNEANNSVAKAVTTGSVAGSADLAVSALSVPASAAPGQQLTIPVTVKNQGTVTAQNFNVTLYFSTDSAITTTDRWLNSAYVGLLAAGAQQTFNLTVTMPAATAGTYFIGAIADPAGGVADSDKTNNALARAVNLTTGTSGMADLVVTAVTSPANVVPGQQVTVPVTVKNQGAAPAQNFNVTLYLSTDSAITASDRWISSAYVGSLPAGAQQTWNLTFTMPAAGAGSYFIGAVADPSNGVTESDESNNSLGKPMTVGALQP